MVGEYGNPWMGRYYPACARRIRADIMPQNRWHSDLDTYLEASQTEAMLLGNLGPAPIGHVLAAIYRNEIGWIGLFGK